jgi:uncharacterized protein DUF2795
MRESTTNGPRLDEALEPEPSGDEDRDVDARTAQPGSLGNGGAEARRELSRQLRMSAFPAARDALLAEAAMQHATPAALGILATLPLDEVFASMHEVWAALEGHADPHAVARPVR